jgi:hypothetical protein
MAGQGLMASGTASSRRVAMSCEGTPSIGAAVWEDQCVSDSHRRVSTEPARFGAAHLGAGSPMVRRYTTRGWNRMVVCLVLVWVLAGLSACSRFLPLPADPRAALMAHWDSLPSEPGVEHRIVRAWRGDVATAGAPQAEVWCVEAEMSLAGDGSVDRELQKWIVIRDPLGQRWTATLLAAMSSTWPSEACG